MNANRMLLVLCTSLWLLGCNTIHGMGRDIEKAGEVIQGSANLAEEPAAGSR
ncbi:entericidin A/B family lipoprotein [Aeromonas caviae]|uniref:entericidin A/B family lipoprotein n=1 Tax=Aeromonas caviae TaxID=648 RepID=UPI0028DEE51D|nr:entericidin A/B family lipoprotein [Aeromonas caviae]MDT8953870.1 entericidin A/B family lipoprotein [Aeromonas caviae]